MGYLSRPNRKLLRSNYSNLDDSLGSRRWRASKVDETTGQVYIEHTASIQSSVGRNWTRQTRLITEPGFGDYTDHPGCVTARTRGERELSWESYREHLDGVRHSEARVLTGARSLQSIAMESILQNISGITLEGIQCLPIHIVKQLWHAISKRCIVSLETWSIFSKLLNQESPIPFELLRYHEVIQTPKTPLSLYTEPLTSLPLDFITSLSISISVSIPDLVNLSKITNLGALEILNAKSLGRIETEPDNFHQGVNDRIIRAWALAANTEGAFSVLRVLRIWCQEDLTCQSLVFLNSFPALAIYDVRGCGFKGNSKLQARQLGWHATVESSITGLLDSICTERASRLQSSAMKPHLKVNNKQPYRADEVRRIPRAEVAAFLGHKHSVSQDQASINKDARNDLAEGFYLNHSSSGRETGRFQGHMLHSSHSSSSCESWPFIGSAAFACIGELRNDSDLSRAGVDVGDQAVVGTELVNSVPIVSLELGNPIAFESSRHPNHHLGLGCLAFIRIKVPSQQSEQSQAMSKPKNSSHIDGGKKEVKGMAKRKKRKLDDVLGSFS